MKMSGNAVVAGIIGWPISHSRSPLIHGHWIEKHKIDGTYIPLAVHPDAAADAIRSLPKLGIAGINVTVPHKLTAFDVVDERDAASQAIGAINTIVVSPEGSLLGSNTDAPGFFAHLRATVPEWDPQAGPVVVLGAGGSARAAIHSLLEAGVKEIRLVNRTKSKAEIIASNFGDKIKVISWSERASSLAESNLLVNTTSLGMKGAHPLEIHLDDLPKEAVVYDIVYVPLETNLLAAAKHRGNKVVDGLGMLLHQAVPGFHAWFGTKPAVDSELRQLILDDLK